MLVGTFMMVSRVISDQVVTKKRQKRYLLFTPNTQWGVYATVSVPLEMYQYVSVAWFFEANYYTVANATWFEPLLGDIYPQSRNREHRSIGERRDIVTRKLFYIFIENMLERQGYPGCPCLLRGICENADSHFLHNGLVGDLLYFILTPSTSISEDDIEDCYYEAEYDGLENNCEKYIEECPLNPLENISLNAEIDFT
ncbi:unnamed protein product [Arctia plantaginis]|uniref:Uncharacterized protein n=1 Tax=Arctia plantaginis TaxID=874455 RepID=A0A8S1BKC9_ARCPL|nr:unnamed protein product [Arctia plantaginis]CAB3260562.1 unnamed protein product [Arctia plantaginis]